ncbi:MBL fold metallo-hydrolase [Hyphococcus flavus]|uniref:MBL fold metallo-hydrolase n=1 Tax=Hyphococcus flavus TaxID=1866326 RepID=A0AAE9ZHK3_9PROT|nr:MBL fold metallo-hydrolase [Hyphococcus flavus]WDI30345.1 MBL fold metallo-hydrolase [Hyphococcus flavus]
MRNFIAMAALLAPFSLAQAHDPAAQATYLGNEGVMVARGETKILFDAFYANSYGQYALVPDEISKAMLNGDAPYDGIDAIFVSHVHGDHFTAEPAIEYMRTQQDVSLYASVQIKDAFLEAGVNEDDPVMKRIHVYDLSPESDPVSIKLDDISVDVVSIPHAGNRPEIQNFAWRVTLDDETTVIHLGDAGTVTADFERHGDHFASRDHDAAFPPYWFYLNDEGRSILETYIGATQTIGVHVPERAAGNGDHWRAEAGGDLFTDPGETRDLTEKPAKTD